MASVARYQRLFRDFLSTGVADAPDGALHAEIIAAAVVAVHNQVLRRWLRGDISDEPLDELDKALRYVRESIKSA